MDFNSPDDLIKKIMEDANNFEDGNVFKTNFNGEELYNLNLESIPCLFGDIIPACGVWTLVGSSDTGKSMLLRQLAINCAKGEAFLGWQNNARRNRVIFVSTEDDAPSTSFLLRKQSALRDGLANLCFCFNSEDVPQFLHQQLLAWPADLVIIDAWSDVFGKDLKDSALIRRTLNVYKSIAARYQCSIGFLHHTGKRTEKLEPSKNNILSGQGYEATMRLVIELRADAANPALRHLCIVKGNYLSNDYKQSSYVLQFNSDTFLFSHTGERVPFEQLRVVTPEAGNTAKEKKATPFYDMEDEEHKALLADIFENESPLKYTELCATLGEVYSKKSGDNYGRDKSRRLLSYLLSSGLIIKQGKDGNSLYTIVTDDDMP